VPDLAACTGVACARGQGKETPLIMQSRTVHSPSQFLHQPIALSYVHFRAGRPLTPRPTPNAPPHFSMFADNQSKHRDGAHLLPLLVLLLTSRDQKDVNVWLSRRVRSSSSRRTPQQQRPRAPPQTPRTRDPLDSTGWAPGAPVRRGTPAGHLKRTSRLLRAHEGGGS